jgi:hypothetical protein
MKNIQFSTIAMAGFCFLIFRGASSFAEFQDLRDIEHMFNAHTFRQGKTQLSLLGPSKFGLLDELEVDSNLILDLVGLYNVQLKLRVYQDPKLSIALEGLLVYVDIDALEITANFIPLMLNTTYQLTPKVGINSGIFDLLFLMDLEDNSGFQESALVHVLGVHFGFDWIITPRHGVTLIAGLPAYYSASLDSEVLDVGASGFDSTAYENIVFFLSYNFFSKYFNFEIGPIFTIGSGLSAPYIALGWRF